MHEVKVMEIAIELVKIGHYWYSCHAIEIAWKRLKPNWEFDELDSFRCRWMNFCMIDDPETGKRLPRFWGNSGRKVLPFADEAVKQERLDHMKKFLESL